MYNDFERKNEDCPECGKKEGASMCSTAWGHTVTCCSDECGFKVKDKINKNIRSNKYKQAIEKRDKFEEKALQIKYNGVGARGYNDSFC